MFFDILVPLAFDKPFSYSSNLNLTRGDLVKVSFANRETVGLVMAVKETCDECLKIKEIKEKLDIPTLKDELMRFMEWTAEYNLIPKGNVLKMIVVSLLSDRSAKTEKTYLIGGNIDSLTVKQKLLYDYIKQNPNSTKLQILENVDVGESVLKNLVKSEAVVEKTTEVRLIQDTSKDFNLNELSEEQQRAFDFIESNKSAVTLLEGATGSGKTEVYFNLISKVLKFSDGQVLILLPEIALTSQLLQRFGRQFGFEPAVWHSEISNIKKNDIFRGVANGDVRVVLGTRSSLFLPFRKLGLIIVDEEHDSSYKQVDNGNYNGRDLAVLRGKLNNITVVLASATPSLETLINVDKNKYRRIYLPSRFGEAVMPDIHIIDMKKERLKRGLYISNTLKGEIDKELKLNRQTLLFMNRRGYAPIVICGECGEKIMCPNCSCAMTYHKSKGRMVCHHCEYFTEKKSCCQFCGSENMVEFGPAVEKIEEEVKNMFPQARTIIMTSDTLNTNKKLEESVNRILNHEVDIIIGTQLVAKGHHFPKLTLVGILDSDATLFGGDIRATERTHQLLTQISGRAGREADRGRVYLQTYTPENLILQAIKNNDSNLLIDFEKENRKLGNFPPYGKIAIISIYSPEEALAYGYAKKIVSIIPTSQNIEVLGPAPLSKIAKNFRFNITIRTERNFNVQGLIKKVLEGFKSNNKLKIKIDIDG